MTTTKSTKLASLGRLALAFTLSLATLAFSASTALAAAEPHPKIAEFGSFTNPNGIAVDESSGDVYVADIGTNTVSKFDANGNPVNFTCGVACATYATANKITATPAGAFSFPSVPGTPAAIAIDNSTSASDPSRGDLYVMDAGHGVIDKFSPSGEYLSQITGFEPCCGSAGTQLRGLAVDASGTVRAEVSSGEASPDSVPAVEEFDDSAANHLIARQIQLSPDQHLSGFPQGPSPGDGFAVGPTGDDYMIFSYSECLCMAKLGQQLAGLGLLDNEGSGDVAIAADPASGHLYADDASSVAEWDAGALNGTPQGKRGARPAGVLVSRFGSGELSGSSGQGGIAVDGSTGEIYVSNPADGKVYVFGSEAPAVRAAAASDVTKEAATLNGTVNPRGKALSTCRFEYGQADGYGLAVYEHAVSCAPQAANLGSGTSPVAVSAQINGLTAGLLYRFRLVAGNAAATSESAGLLAAQGPPFGVRVLEVSFLNEDGTPDTQAGSHPYRFVNTIEFNWHYMPIESNADSIYAREPAGTLRDLKVDLPPGFVADPNATPKKCTLQQLFHEKGSATSCPPESLLGTFEVRWDEHLFGYDNFVEPVYNMAPPRGTALQLGIQYVNTDIFIDNGALAGGDYPVQATVEGAPPEAPALRTILTLSGVLSGSTAFMILPTGCHGPLRSTIEMDSYQEPGHWVGKEEVTRNAAGRPVSLSGCSKLIFPPTISVSPDTHDASTSSGLTVKVHVPQNAAQNPDGLAESSLRDTTVALPAGVAINPSGGDGLEACSEGLAGFEIGRGVNNSGFEEFNKAFEPGVLTPLFNPTPLESLQPGVSLCPDGSKIGTVKIKTPLLEHELEGSVYLASQGANPFGSLLAMYMMVEDPFSGSTIKLTGEVQLCAGAGEVIDGVSCQGQGQIVTTFKNTPDLPFEDLELHFFGGERAPLSTPTRCGTYTTQAVFTPWDGNGPVTAESSFNIDHGPGGGPCPGATLPFSPTVSAGATNIQAGAFSPLTVTMNRKDGEQNLKSIVATLPPGLSGVLTGVELCPEPRANEGLCGENSKVGEATIGVGVGNQPFTVTGGKFYLTGPYNGRGSCTVGEAGCAPFGLTFEVPAKAGPFDLKRNTANPAGENACDCVIVRGKIELDPLTTAITITTDPPGSPHSIPTSIEGIPLEIQHVNATTTRGNFQFNPTSCAKMSLTGTLLLSEGGLSTISTPFQVTNCAVLGFKPGFKVSTSGKTSRSKGASLTAKLTYPKAPFGSQANIARVKVDLPKQLPSRLTTLQKACTAAQFNANPAGCPAASFIGHAKAITPILPVPLEGPAIFVSHGGEAFPSLIVVLQGYGVTIDLVGSTFISKAGITSSTFKTVPDQPVTSFELTLPEGPYSALTANASNLCALTRTVMVKKRVTVRTRGRKRTLTRRVKQILPASLSMPTEFVAQNGATLHQSTPVSVTGCAKAVRHERKKNHRKKK